MTTANFNYEQYAHNLMGLVGITGWTFHVNNRLSRALGRCVRSSKGNFIEVSGSFLRNGKHADILDTIAHEVAHAAAWDFDGHWGHGKEWKKWCEVVGATPSPRCNLDNETRAALAEQDRFVLCVVHNEDSENGEKYQVEMVTQTTKRRTNLRGKQLIGRPSTRGKLGWYDKHTQRITTY